MTKAQEVHERIEEFVASGVKKADAFRQLAEETGKPVKSLQGAYYQHSKKLGGGTPKTRTRETTPLSAVESAKQVLERALTDIDREVEAAKGRADEAKAEYEALKASASERKQQITTKIEALEA